MIRKNLLLKSFSYRIFGSLATALIAFVITGNFALGVTIGIADTVVKIILFYFHEIAWEKAEKLYNRFKGNKF